MSLALVVCKKTCFAELFEKFKVKTLLMELYPRGLLFAGVDMLQFMRFIYDDLGMFCSTSGAAPARVGFGHHPNSLEDFAAMLQRQLYYAETTC